ncbi:MAG: EAL domain-containing protein, partial [Pseudomonadales bacterium]|nr:EAL domain-containing protein [Pseudomonadales bacterium]
MTLRFRAFLVSFCILLVFVAVFTLQWQLQDRREGVAEIRIQELMSQAFSSVVIAAERDALTTVKALSSTYTDLGTSKGDATIKEGLLGELGVKHDLDFLYVLTGGGHLISSFHPDDGMAQNSEPLRDLDGVLFNQVAGLRWQTTGVAYWQREPLYLTVGKVGNNDEGVRYFVAGYFLKSLFGELNAIYEFEATLDGVASSVSLAGSIRAKSELKGLITAPINVWIDDQSSPSYRGVPWMLVGIWCVGVIGALLIWLFISRSMVDRLRYFVQQAHDIGATQDYGKRVKLQGEDELTDLVSHYNAVVSALEYSYNLMAKANLITTDLIGRVGAGVDSVGALSGQVFSPAGIAQDEESDLRQSLDMVAKLSDVVERDTLEIYYQPIVNAESGGVLGFEALCRWLDPDFGVVEPSEFIALAEKSGQMKIIGQQMVMKSCRDIGKLHS